MEKFKRVFLGFTMMELLVVVIILGVVAGFALPNYRRSIERSHENDMVNQLRVIHAAALMYRAQTDVYLVGTLSTDAMNSQLGLSVMSSDGTDYTYTSADGTTFQADAGWRNFTIEVTNAPLSANNPCCTTANCPTLPGC